VAIAKCMVNGTYSGRGINLKTEYIWNQSALHTITNRNYICFRFLYTNIVILELEVEMTNVQVMIICYIFIGIFLMFFNQLLVYIDLILCHLLSLV